jgi:hypothetical protein
MQIIAGLARNVINGATDEGGDWDSIHCPYVSEAERGVLSDYDCKMISAARCARVSYRGSAKGFEDDMELAKKLATSNHWSPFEHVATWMPGAQGSCLGENWLMFRKEWPIEVEYVK